MPVYPKARVNKMPSQNREGRTTIYGPFTPNGPVLSPNLWCLLGETFLWQVGVHYIVHVRRFELEPAVKKLFNVKEVLLVVVAGQLVIGMLGQVVLIREERPHTPQMQDALSAIHDGQLIPAHEFVTRLLVRCAVAGTVAASVRCVVNVDCLFPKRGCQLFESGIFRAAEEYLAVHVPDDGVGVVLIQRLELALRLQNQAGRNFPAADGSHQLLQVRDLPDVGALVDEAPYMDRQPPAVHIVGLFAQQIEQLGVDHRNQEVEGAIGVAHNQEQRCFPVAQGVQFQLIVGGNFPQFCDVEGGKASTAGNQNRLCGLARNELSRTF